MIIVKLKGGMGNQMFQYALGRALSLKYKDPLCLDLVTLLDRTPRSGVYKTAFYEYNLDVFNVDAKLMSESEVGSYYRTIISKIRRGLLYLKSFVIKTRGVEKYFHFDPEIKSIGPNACLDGYWQSPKYFSEVEDTIRKDFTFKEKFSDKIENLMQKIKNQNSVCVHIRRGDYIGNPLHDIVGKDYYVKGIEKIKELTNVDKIYVFSNDIKWCEENIKFNYPTMFVGDEYVGKKDEGHLALMSACRNFVITNSSFSWWAAWLSENKNKIVVCPKQWFGDPTIDTSDLIPENWIRI